MHTWISLRPRSSNTNDLGDKLSGNAHAERRWALEGRRSGHLSGPTEQARGGFPPSDGAEGEAACKRSGAAWSSGRHYSELIEAHARAGAVALGTLVSGHKKDVVITNLLARMPGRVAFTAGSGLAVGRSIQPLSTVHGVCYEDYSHGIRLVSETAWQNGAMRPVRDILQDPAAAPVLSDEGAIRAVFASVVQPAAMLATFTPGFCSSGIRDGN